MLSLAAAAGCEAQEILDFSASINPLGPPPWLHDVVDAHVADLVHYPDGSCRLLIQAICAQTGADPDEVLVGNGSSEILWALPRVLPVGRAVIPAPCYSEYARAARLAGLEVVWVRLREERSFVPDLDELEEALLPGDLVFLGQPNNPTGVLFDGVGLRELAGRHPKTWFVVDESFMDFVEDEGVGLRGRRPENVILVRSLTKFYAIPGLRLGYALADAAVAASAKEQAIPWSVNTLAQAVGTRAVSDEGHAARTRSFVAEQRARLESGLRRLPGVRVFPGQANFLLVKVEREDVDALILRGRLLEDRIAIRFCGDMEGLDDRFFRVAVRTGAENERLVEALAAVLSPVGRAHGDEASR